MEDESGENELRAERRAIRKRAMDLLARREHAPAELAAKLRQRGYAQADIGVVLDDLAADNLLSAARYAQAVVAAKSARGIGPLRIRAELARAGVDETLIDTALAEADVDWQALAQAVRIKRFGSAPPPDFPTRAKQMRFLQRRGFDADQLRGAFDD